MKCCTVCCKVQTQRFEPLIPSCLPELPWQKIGTDLFEWKQNTYLLITDDYSRFTEISRLNRTTADEAIVHIKSIFARLGIPEIVVSDNEPQYTSEVYAKYAHEYQFEHATRSLFHSQSNGEAECAVKIVKRLLKKEGDTYLALLSY